MILKEIADGSSIPISIITSLIYNEDGRYREFSIRKRAGGTRTITVPVPYLGKLQKYIYNTYLKYFPVHDAAVGFRPGMSILDHIKPHLGSKIFIKLDIKDCFPSITSSRLFSCFVRNGFMPKEAFYLTSLCSHKNSLPQGAPSSPALCNIALKQLDVRIHNFSRTIGSTYTRYADDILLSGDKINISSFRALTEIVKSEGFTPNDKSKFVSNPSKLVVCGISIATGEAKIPRDFKRKLRMDAHFIIKNGIIKECMKTNHIDPFHYDRIMGRLAYWNMIEPTAHFPSQMRKELRLRFEDDIGV